MDFDPLTVRERNAGTPVLRGRNREERRPNRSPRGGAGEDDTIAREPRHVRTPLAGEGELLPQNRECTAPGNPAGDGALQTCPGGAPSPRGRGALNP